MQRTRKNDNLKRIPKFARWREPHRRIANNKTTLNFSFTAICLQK